MEIAKRKLQFEKDELEQENKRLKIEIGESLNLANNNLSGQIPFSLGYLASLEMLSLRGNRFSGELPSSLQNCMQLKSGVPRVQPEGTQDDSDVLGKWFYAGMGFGFVLGVPGDMPISISWTA
ncbi:phytosulfokine receptor 1-like [Durio zibethinus]|uniref:Phytosulfokine receptor 1-like n=1 Tax=Durio zibethinus TaxID=66656 RepID=A0A6P5WPD8_DURZI|nr:phytosulfokine receptor 1-like [Durio zibethinus]